MTTMLFCRYFSLNYLCCEILMNDLVKVDLEKFSSKSFLARFASGQLANLRKCFARVSEMIVIDSAKNIKCNECEGATRLFSDDQNLDFHI